MRQPIKRRLVRAEPVIARHKAKQQETEHVYDRLFCLGCPDELCTGDCIRAMTARKNKKGAK